MTTDKANAEETRPAVSQKSNEETSLHNEELYKEYYNHEHLAGAKSSNSRLAIATEDLQNGDVTKHIIQDEEGIKNSSLLKDLQNCTARDQNIRDGGRLERSLPPEKQNCIVRRIIIQNNEQIQSSLSLKDLQHNAVNGHHIYDGGRIQISVPKGLQDGAVTSHHIYDGRRIQTKDLESGTEVDYKMKDENGKRNSSLRVSFSDSNNATVIQPIYSDKRSRFKVFEKYTSCRWRAVMACWLVVCVNFSLRQCMSMAIVCMTSMASLNHTNLTETPDKEYVLDWDSETQGMVLTSYFYGFPFTPIIGGYLAGKFSSKRCIIYSMLTTCIASALIPVAAVHSPYLVMVARVFVGFASGGYMPCTMQVLAKWAPQTERAQMTSIVTSGQSVGNIFTFMISGLICSIPIQSGWPFIFYIFIGCNLLGLAVWCLVVHDSPELHPKLDVSELAYILRRRNSSAIKMPNPPWRKMISSKPIWAILIAHVSHGYIFTTIGTYLPIYMKDILDYDPEANGLLSSLPFIGRFLGCLLNGYIADKLLVMKCMKAVTIRKLFQIIGSFGCAPFLVVLGFLTKEDRTLAVTLLVCYWTVQSATNAAFRVSHIDIAPLYAGLLNGITLTCAALACLIAPIVTTYITRNKTREEWQTVFAICVAVSLVGGLSFVILCAAEEQEWAKDPNSRQLSEELNISVTDESRKTSIESTETTVTAITTVSGEHSDPQNNMQSLGDSQCLRNIPLSHDCGCFGNMKITKGHTNPDNEISSTVAPEGQKFDNLANTKANQHISPPQTFLITKL